MTKQGRASTAAGHGPGGCLLEAHDLIRSYGQTTALRGASVSAAAGEILAVMGPSGSGKSTLLHCLAGILKPDSGQVWFDGRRIDALRENERSALRRDRFGFVFQFGQLVPELTAEENVALPLLVGGTRRAQALAAARAWFGGLGLDGLVFGGFGAVLADPVRGVLDGHPYHAADLSRFASPSAAQERDGGHLYTPTGLPPSSDLVVDCFQLSGSRLQFVVLRLEFSNRCNRHLAARTL